MSTFFHFFASLTLSLNLIVGEELLELGCLEDQQCKHFERPHINVSCFDSLCRCINTAFNETAGLKIVKCIPQDLTISNIIGGHCPCHLPQAECNEEQNICYCAQGHVASADKRRCLAEKVLLGETCEIDKQCHFADFYAVCDAINKICKCQTNFISNNGTCVSVTDSSATCRSDSDCSVFGSNVVCLKESHKCICNEHYVKAKNKTECLPLVAYQENCTENQQCFKKLGPGGSCISGLCECSEKHYVLQKHTTMDGKYERIQVMCTRIIQIGEYCYEDKDCFHPKFSIKEQPMRCKFSECNCKSGYYSIDSMQCVKSGGVNVSSRSVWSVAILAIVKALRF